MNRKLASIFPGYFALVMATGTVSISAHKLGHAGIGWALFLCNIAAYLLFWTAGLIRLTRERLGLLREIARHATGPGFLTIVAGTGVLGSEFAAFHLAIWVVPALRKVPISPNLASAANGCGWSSPPNRSPCWGATC